MTPVNLANRIIYMATRTYDALNYSWWWGYPDDEWDPPDYTSPVTDKDVPQQVGILAMLIHRFVLGLSAVGSLSFISWAWQARYEHTISILIRFVVLMSIPCSLLGPFRIRTFRGSSRNNRRNSAGSFTTILVLVFIVIGVARFANCLSFSVESDLTNFGRTMRKLYILNRSVAQRMLATVEDVILEVG